MNTSFFFFNGACSKTLTEKDTRPLVEFQFHRENLRSTEAESTLQDIKASKDRTKVEEL